MVYSNLNSTVFYNESGNIDLEDVGHEAVLYEMEIFGKRLLVVFGKLKHTFIQRNVVYLPVYLVVHHKVKVVLGLLSCQSALNLDEICFIFKLIGIHVKKENFDKTIGLIFIK